MSTETETPEFRLRCAVHGDLYRPAKFTVRPVHLVCVVVPLIACLAGFVDAGESIPFLFAGLALSCLISAGDASWHLLRLRNEILIHADRLAFRALIGGERQVIAYEDVDVLVFSRSWIRLGHRDGRRFRFRGSGLVREDVFDFLADRVAQANPACPILDRSA